MGYLGIAYIVYLVGSGILQVLSPKTTQKGLEYLGKRHGELVGTVLFVLGVLKLLELLGLPI